MPFAGTAGQLLASWHAVWPPLCSVQSARMLRLSSRRPAVPGAHQALAVALPTLQAHVVLQE